MKYDQKFEELLIVFIITSITYFGIKIFFQFMKVTKVKKKEEKKEVVEGFIGSILSIPFDMFKWMGEKIIDSFEKYEAKEIGQGIFGFFCCCILPLFVYWKFKKSKSKISTAAAPAAAPAPAPVAATAAIAV